MRSKNGQKNRFIARNELFGATIYDRQTLTYQLVDHKDLKNKVEDWNSTQTGFDTWTVKTDSEYQDILFSPVRVYYEFTRACNLRCKTCFNASAKALRGELTTAEALRSIEELRKAAVFDIRFSGGEVTVRPDWFEVLSYAVSLGHAVSLNTNGVYNDDDTIDKIVALGLEQVTVSIDGLEETHNKIRGDGTFKQSFRALKELHSKRAITRINTVLTTESAREVEQLLELVSPYISEINFFYMRPTGRALGIKGEMLSHTVLNQTNKAIEDLRSKYSHIRILHGVQIVQENSIVSLSKKNLGLQMGGPDGFTRMTLLSDGTFWPGGYTPHLDRSWCAGNIKNEGYSILRLWRESPTLKKFRKKSVNQQRVCHTCPIFRKDCGGADMEMELYRERNLEKKNPYCIY